MRRAVVESRADRLELARDAGFGAVSPGGALAGTMVAYGTTVLLLAVAAALTAGFSDGDLRVDDWRTMGAGASIAVALTLFVAYAFGGYVAGRMARRAGAANGLAVFVTGIAVAVVAGFVVSRFTEGDAVLADIRSLGVPTSGDEWMEAGTIAGIASLVAMLIGSLYGGIVGERWHARLVERALDPTVGPDAEPPVERRDTVDTTSHPVVPDYTVDTTSRPVDRDYTGVVTGGEPDTVRTSDTEVVPTRGRHVRRH